MHFKSLRHVRDHVKVQGRPYDLLTHIALHTHMHTGEAFELSVERQAHRHQITPEWTRILLNGLIATGELVVVRSRGRHPNRYRFPLEQCQACQGADPEVELESTPNSITLPSQAAKRKALWLALIERDGEHCVVPHCSDLDLTIDHKVPTRKGGTDDLDNLQLMCRYHNGLKGDRLMSEFNKRLEGLNPELQLGVRGGEDSLNPKLPPSQPHTEPQTLPAPTPNSDPANPKVREASTPCSEPIEPQKEVKELKEYKEGPTPNFAHARDKAETASPFWCPDCGYAIPSCVHRTAYRVQPRQEVTRSAPVWGVRLAVHPASP